MLAFEIYSGGTAIKNCNRQCEDQRDEQHQNAYILGLGNQVSGAAT